MSTPTESKTNSRGGAPVGNRNRLRHGLRSRKLPFKGGRTIMRYRNSYRSALEDTLLAQGREIGPYEASCIAAATAWYTHALKASFWLGRAYDDLEPEQRLNFSREEARGMEQMARIVEKLGIDKREQSDLWASFTPPVYVDSEPATTEATAEPSDDENTLDGDSEAENQEAEE